ncbi:MAG: alpha-galactosidase, partial [Pedobacter sp.]|nr:alpha-galactosidase [Pedobacter sp.]
MLLLNKLNAQQLPIWNTSEISQSTGDWLITHSSIKAEIFKTANDKDLILYNGFLKREFRLSPSPTCISYKNMVTGKQLLREVKEEARLIINGKRYFIGGLKGQKEKGYLLPEWLDTFTAMAQDFKYTGYTVQPIEQQLKWETKFWTSSKKNGTGKMLTFHYTAIAPQLIGLDVDVNYELYDGIPLIVKSLNLKNNGRFSMKIDSVVNEVLGMVEEESAVAGKFDSFKKPQGIYFETNYAFNNSMRYVQSDQTTHWKPDTAYKSQVHYEYLTPVLLEIYPDHAPGIDLKPGGTYNSVRTHELLMDNDDRERCGLAIRKMYAHIAPWVLANPIFMHLVSSDDKEVYSAIDQCAATGYEALILSFGSHLHMEDTSDANINKWKKIADYAHSKNVSIGCYSLFSSRTINDEEDIIDPKTNKP